MRKKSESITDLCDTPVKISLTEDILFSIYTNKLFSFLEVRTEPLIDHAAYAIGAEF